MDGGVHVTAWGVNVYTVGCWLVLDKSGYVREVVKGLHRELITLSSGQACMISPPVQNLDIDQLSSQTWTNV